MSAPIPEEGAASPAVMKMAAEIWAEFAKQAGIDLSKFHPLAPLADRLAWALSLGLTIGCILSRYSSKMQQSTASQVSETVTYAARNGIYVPPEYICVDEAQSGRKEHRNGFNRMLALLELRNVNVLLVLKLSRIFRKAYRSAKFLEEEVVGLGKRAIAIADGIDTNIKKSWKALSSMQGLCDEFLLEAIADHVRSGLRFKFMSKLTVGALTLGYEAVPVEGTAPDAEGKVPKRPQIHEPTAAMIRQHFLWISQGMSLSEGFRRWVRDGGGYDPRSTLKRLSPSAYRRMLSNPRYMGLWSFGVKRNNWNSKLDYNQQELQAASEVSVLPCDELAIVSEELFNQVQAVLATKKGRERGSRRVKTAAELWALVTGCFFCSECKDANGEPLRMYQSGAQGRGMRCKNGVLCPRKCMVRRKEAVAAICKALTELLKQDRNLIVEIVAAAQMVGAAEIERYQAELVRINRRISTLTSKLNVLYELAGSGTKEDCAENKAQIDATRAQRAAACVERDQLQKLVRQQNFAVTPEQVEQALSNLMQLLSDGASGKLGEDVVHQAASAFTALVGERVFVVVEQREGRKSTNVRGVFRPNLLPTIQQALDDPRPIDQAEAPEVEVWLRKPPEVDLLAPIVHHMVDELKLSLRTAEAELTKLGHKLHANSVRQAYRRYYQMIGQPVPKMAYNNGHGRKSA